ncbi:MAG: LytTR family transcriptional regulator DNA-binding domain-containing protein [Lachnospiraceae bacterium]|nr:LytTR family transcriptional regulator DNA-binding domain-containing protein [Lachnospiraceae bacterium]
MNNMVDIEVILDEECIDPRIRILTREKTRQVENIIYAIENVTESEYPRIPAVVDEGLEFFSQRDIIRAFTEGRKVLIQTESGTYPVRKRLSALEEDLNPTRFVRISQSEIINIYKVKRFDINISGTIGVEFENGTKSWAARSCVKAIKELIRS